MSPRFRTDERNLFDRLTSSRAGNRIQTARPCEARVNLANELGHHLRNSSSASIMQLDSPDLALVRIERKPLQSTQNLSICNSPCLLSRLTRQEDKSPRTTFTEISFQEEPVPTLESRWICCTQRILPANTGGSTRWTIVSSNLGPQALLDSI